MVAIITERDGNIESGDRSVVSRILWFIGLWGLGVLTLFLVGSALRYFMFP